MTKTKQPTRWFQQEDQLYELDDLIVPNHIYFKLKPVFDHCHGVLNNFQALSAFISSSAPNNKGMRQLLRALQFLTCQNLHSFVCAVKLANEGFCTDSQIIGRTMYERMLSARLICLPPAITRAEKFLKFERTWLEKIRQKGKNENDAVKEQANESFDEFVPKISKGYVKTYHANSNPKKLPLYWHGYQNMKIVANMTGSRFTFDHAWGYLSEIVHFSGAAGPSMDDTEFHSCTFLEVDCGAVRVCVTNACCLFLDTWIAFAQYFPSVDRERATVLREAYKAIVSRMPDSLGEKI